MLASSEGGAQEQRDDSPCGLVRGDAACSAALPQGELNVSPGIKHAITPFVCTVALAFLLRHAPDRGGAPSRSDRSVNAPHAEPQRVH